LKQFHVIKFTFQVWYSTVAAVPIKMSSDWLGDLLVTILQLIP